MNPTAAHLLVRMPRRLTRQRQYFTGLVANREEVKETTCPINGASWRVSFVKPRCDNFIGGREVAIVASSWTSAQCALNLILSSLDLISGDSPIFDMETGLVAHNAHEPEFDDPVFRGIVEGKGLSTPGVPLACSVAAKASRRQEWIYAIAKYKFTISLFGVHHVDLEPFRSQHLPVSRVPEDHVRFSYAIISAHSILEDLKLEVRASPSKPSRINGEWNQIVKEDLENRLASAGVDLNEPLLWTVRGPKRLIEKTREIPLVTKAPWSKGPMVRDCKVQLIDAIAYTDWLRDRIASHSVKELTKVLSPYDVVNVQHLARRLIMETLGVWRFHQRQDRHSNKSLQADR